MFHYILNNKIISIQMVITTFTAYGMYGFFDDVLLPLTDKYINKKDHKLIYDRFCTKVTIWLLLISCCFVTDLSFV